MLILCKMTRHLAEQNVFVPLQNANSTNLSYTFIQFITTEKVWKFSKLQALVYAILLSTTAIFSYAIGSRKLSANEQFFCWCSNSSKFVTKNSGYIRRLFWLTMLLTPAQIKPKSFESRRNSSFFFTRGGCASCLRACLGARLLLQSYQYPNLSEGAERRWTAARR